MIMQAGVPGGTLYPQIEYQPIGTPFVCGSGACATATEGGGQAGPGPVNCAQTANSCAIEVSPEDDVYHWQARVRYNVGGIDYFSNWAPFGGNGEDATDFKIDASAPMITFPGGNTCSEAVTSLSTNGATITWYLNELADGQVEYSKNSSLTGAVFFPIPSGDPAFSHAYNLNNLDSNTTYYFRVISADAEGNQALKPDSSPYCSFTTLNVDQPAKTVRFYVEGRPDAISGGVSTSTAFSVHIPEESISFKSSFLELTGLSLVSGTNEISVQINSQPSLTYDIAGPSNFKILYKVDPSNINIYPAANLLTLNPSQDTNIISAKFFTTYSFEP